ncbi:MAG: hypothetical protein V4696_07410 [Pseudomonadota bacterium]
MAALFLLLKIGAGKAFGFIGGIFKWLFAEWYRPVMLALALFAGFQMLRAGNWEEKANSETAHADAIQAAFDETVEDYRQASEAAQRAAVANVERVEAEQERITENVTTDYRARIADARARYERLRAQARSNSGSPDATGMPSASDPASGIDGATEPNGLSDAERLEATEIALRLEALQDWVRQTSAVVVVPN